MFNNQVPYNSFYPYQGNFNNLGARRGLLSGLGMGIKSINWSNLLNNTQKTLNVINQAIPVYYQVKPIYNNAKTMLRMVTALKANDSSTNNTATNSTLQKEKNTTQNGPVFFL